MSSRDRELPGTCLGGNYGLEWILFTVRRPRHRRRHARARMLSRISRVSDLRAFTLIELLAVVAMIALLAALLMPALNRAYARAHSAVCLNNLKQLQIAWQMYADDHGGQLPENYADLSTGVWRSSLNSWTGPSSAPFDQGDLAIRQGTFFRLGYIRSPATFRCPADDSVARPLAGLPRTRSYAMNGNFGGRSQESQRVLQRENLGFDSSKVFVFVDEHEDSIDDAHFLAWPKPDDRWVNMPAARHSQSGAFSFVDGHVEQWKWRWPKTFKKKESYWKRAENEADLADLRRLQTSILQMTDVYTPQE